MAFNPFSWFRKHQRGLLAVVTIFIMFLFILTGIKGGLEDRSNWFGMDYSPVVTKIYGTKVTQRELSDTESRRRVVNEYLFQNVFANHNKALNELLGKHLKPDPQKMNGMLTNLEQLRGVAGRVQQRNMFILPQLRQYTQFLGQSPAIPALLEGQVGRQLQEMRQDLHLLEELGGTATFVDEHPERLVWMEKLAVIMGMQRWEIARIALAAAGQPVDDMYFGGQTKRVDDTLDFIMWREQAKKLGIELTDTDIARQINREAATEIIDVPENGTVDLTQEPKIQAFLSSTRQTGGIKTKEFIKGLREEFAAVMAQSLILGHEPGVRATRGLLGASASPSAVTPEEFYNFYRRMRTPVKVSMLGIPAEKFLDKVKTEPTEAELRARYDKYKDREANPGYRDPGFKEPRRILAQYVTVEVEHPSFVKPARDFVATWTGEAGAKARAERVFASALSPSFGGGPLGQALSLSPPLIFDPVRRDYGAIVNDQTSWVAWEFPELTTSQREIEWDNMRRKFRPTSVANAETAKLLIGGIVGGSNVPLGGLANLYTASATLDTHGAITQTGSVILGLSDTWNLYGTAALGLANQPHIPYQQAEPHLADGLATRLTRDLAIAKLDSINSEIVKLKKQPKEVEEYVAKVVKDNPSLKLGGMDKAKTGLALADELEKKVDVGLGDLLLIARKEYPDMRTDRDLAEVLFFRGGDGAFDPRMLGRGADTEKKAALWWRKEDLPARERKYEEAKELVIRAWKMDRARVLAQEEARKLADSIEQNKGPISDANRALNEAQKKFDLAAPFELESVSPLITVDRVHPNAIAEYHGYGLPADKRALMPYIYAPSLARQVTMMSKPGEAMVIADQPQTTYYVAVLQARDQKTVEDFAAIYRQTPRYDTLYLSLATDKAAEYRRTVLESMRAEAGKLGKDGRFEVPEEFRRRESSELD